MPISPQWPEVLAYNFHKCIYYYSSLLIRNTVKSHPVAFNKLVTNALVLHSRYKWTVKVIEKNITDRHAVKSMYVM